MDDVETVATFSEDVLELEGLEAPNGYAHLPLCIIDAVFSLGITYAATRNVVKSYIRWARERGSPVDDEGFASLEDPSREQTIAEFLELISELSDEQLAEGVFQNHNLTSSRSGIPKARAVRLEADVLAGHGIHTRQDLLDHAHDAELKRAWRDVPGQGPGKSWRYLLMLAGHEEVKPDRMIVRFVSSALDRQVSSEEARQLLTDAQDVLQDSYPQLTLRALDNAAWQRARDW